MSFAALAAAFAALATVIAIGVVVWSQRTLAETERRTQQLLASCGAEPRDGPEG